MKTERLEISLSPEEKKKLTERAQSMGESLSSYLVFCGLNARITVQIGCDPTVKNLQDLLSLKEKGVVDEEEFQKIKKEIFEREVHGLIFYKKRGHL